jgi:uncharacterized FlaG/YvyC family protein
VGYQANNNSNIGTQVTYNGQKGVVTSSSQNSAYLTVKLEDGSTVSVPKDAALLSFKEESNNYFDKQIEQCDKSIEKYKTIIEENKDLWSAYKKSIKGYRDQIGSLLSSCGVSNATQLDDEHKAIYTQLKEDKTNARLRQIGASAGIQYDTIAVVGLCSYKQYLLGQQYVTNCLYEA